MYNLIMKEINLIESIGHTPLVRLKNIEEMYHLPYKIFAKLERNNPSGSVKDRPALYIVKDGIRKGLIDKDSTIIEATSGNMGISLAMIASALNLKCLIVMPENASKERKQMIEAYGAKVMLTKKEDGMEGSVKLANELAKNVKNSFLASQFDNSSNLKAHYETTSKEILEDLNNNLDVFIAGVGTGGTISGCAKRFKEVLKNVEIIGVEPKSSPLLNKGYVASHKIQGLGPNFIPNILSIKLIDRIIDVSDEDAYEFSRVLAKKEGILAGISSGAALFAATTLDKNLYKDKNICLILPDNGERYLSVEGLYEF